MIPTVVIVGVMVFARMIVIFFIEVIAGRIDCRRA